MLYILKFSDQTRRVAVSSSLETSERATAAVIVTIKRVSFCVGHFICLPRCRLLTDIVSIAGGVGRVSVECQGSLAGGNVDLLVIGSCLDEHTLGSSGGG